MAPPPHHCFLCINYPQCESYPLRIIPIHPQSYTNCLIEWTLLPVSSYLALKLNQIFSRLKCPNNKLFFISWKPYGFPMGACDLWTMVTNGYARSWRKTRCELVSALSLKHADVTGIVCLSTQTCFSKPKMVCKWSWGFTNFITSSCLNLAWGPQVHNMYNKHQETTLFSIYRRSCLFGPP